MRSTLYPTIGCQHRNVRHAHTIREANFIVLYECSKPSEGEALKRPPAPRGDIDRRRALGFGASCAVPVDERFLIAPSPFPIQRCQRLFFAILAAIRVMDMSFTRPSRLGRGTSVHVHKTLNDSFPFATESIAD